MSIDLPWQPAYLRVGSLFSDSSGDADRNPDVTWGNSGTVELEPVIGRLVVVDENGVEAVLTNSAKVGVIKPGGRIAWDHDPQSVENNIVVVDLTDESLTDRVTNPSGKTHTLRLTDVYTADGALLYKRAVINVRIAADEAGVDGIVNLARQIPASAATPVIVDLREGEQGVSVVDASQPAPGKLALELSDGSTTSEVDLPPGTLPDGPSLATALGAPEPRTALTAQIVDVVDRSPLRTSNAFAGWWSEPRAMCQQQYDLTFVGAASSAGEFLALTFDARGHAVRRSIVGTLPVRDDHNAPAILVATDRPALVAYSGHDTASAVNSRKAPGTNGVSGDGTVDSLGADLAVGGALPGSAVTTYASLLRKPATSVVMALTRVSGTDWRWTYSTNSGTSWTAWATNALIDFTGTDPSRKGYVIAWDDITNQQVHFFAYNNPAQGDRNIYHWVLDWATENFIRPSDGSVISSLRSPGSTILVASETDIIHTTTGGKRVRLSHPDANGDVWITEYTVASGVVTSEVVVLERSGPTAWTRRPLGISAGVPFGGVGNGPYLAGMASPNPQPAGKKVVFIGRNSGGVHYIEKHTVTTSWAETRTVEIIATSSRPLVRPICPVNAGSIDVLWTEVIKYGINGYPDANADINFFGDMVAHYRPVDEAWPAPIEPPNAAPVAGFTYTPTLLSVAFTDTSTDADGTIASRAWNFGDGTTSTTTNPTHAYATAGTYTVTLTVTDDDGATNTASQTITVTATTAATIGSLSSADVGASTATSLTWAHTVTADDDALAVFISHNNAGGADELPSSVTYDGIAMTLVDSVVAGTGSTSGRVGSVWKLNAPPVGTANIVATKVTAARMVGVGVGVRDTAGSLGTIVKDTSASARTSATTVTTSPDTSLVLVFDVYAGVGTATPSSGGTMRVTKASSTTIQANLSTWAGGTSIAQTVTYPSSVLLAQIAVPVLAA